MKMVNKGLKRCGQIFRQDETRKINLYLITRPRFQPSFSLKRKFQASKYELVDGRKNYDKLSAESRKILYNLFGANNRLIS